MPRIVTIQFITAGKMYDFDAGTLELAPGDRVVVESERGLGIGTVVRGPVERDPSAGTTLAPIRRTATGDDLATLERNIRLEREAFEFCLKRIVERGMQMKLVRVEYQFDGSKAVFFFTADGRVDFRDLVKDLAHTFHTRIEMRQIGVRDESKMIGGIGICGRELCCCSFLREFQPVSVKMAKEQNLALNPSKISGQCGRLLCCLDYEYETYCSLRKNFPKCGKRVRTATAAGTVDKINILTGTITLKLDDNKLVTIKRDEITADGAAADVPLQAAPQETARSQNRPAQRERGERRQPAAAPLQQEKPQPPAALALPPDSAAPTGEEKQPAAGSGKKRGRNRKHGHRRKQNDTPRTPSGTPGA